MLTNYFEMKKKTYDYLETPIKVHKETLHNVELSDPYRWLENVNEPKVQKWIQKQNAFTEELLELPARDKLREELMEVMDYEKVTCYKITDDYLFYTKKVEGKNQPFLLTKNRDNGEEEILLDPNQWNEEGTESIDWFYPSPQGSLLVYGRSSGGDEVSTLYIFDLENKQQLKEEIPFTRNSSVAWNPDGSGFFYTRNPKPGDVLEGEEVYHRKLFYHIIGQNYEEDELIIGELEAKEEMISISLCSDNTHYIITRSIDWAKNDLYIMNLDEKIPQPICKGLDAQFHGDMINENLYLMTNYQAPNGKIILVNLHNSNKDEWIDLIPEKENIIIRDIELIGGHIVLLTQENISQDLEIFDLEGKKISNVELPPFKGSIINYAGRWSEKEFYFVYTSFFYPQTIFKAHVSKNISTVDFKPWTTVNPDEYEIEQHWYESKDKTKVPLYLIKNKKVTHNSENPALINGYGGFNVSILPSFMPDLKVLLDRGMILVIPNIRGGGEFGKSWHLAGRKEKKQTVFDDFIAASEWLIENNYTNPNKLAAYGRSNGGLLMGAIMTQRPDLYKAIVCGVPLLDMLRYHKFLIARFWIPEYGSAEHPEDFEYLLAYSPYHNVKPTFSYPATYFFTALSDTRVHPLHAMKMTALLQKIEKTKPILLKIEKEAGHGVGKPLWKKVEETLDRHIFVYWQLGMKE